MGNAQQVCLRLEVAYATIRKPVGGLASIRLGRCGNCVADAPHASLRHMLPALVAHLWCDCCAKPLYGPAKCRKQPERYNI